MRYSLDFVGVCAVSMVVAAGAAAWAEAPHHDMVLIPDSAAVQWQPGFPVLPKGIDLAVLSGNPEDGPFVLRVRVPADTVIAPHSHPTPETLTVVEGDVFHAMGKTVDKTKGDEMKQGGFVYLPAGTNHYLWTKTATVLQVNGTGPFKVLWVDPADDPKNAK